VSLYPGEYYDAGGAKNRRSIEIILKSLRLCGGLGSVLDIGCARGTLLEVIAPCATTRTGVDLSAVAIEAAQKRRPDAVLTVADVQEALPFVDASFNTIFMLDVLEHLERPLDALGGQVAGVRQRGNGDGDGRSAGRPRNLQGKDGGRRRFGGPGWRRRSRRWGRPEGGARSGSNRRRSERAKWRR